MEPATDIKAQDRVLVQFKGTNCFHTEVAPYQRFSAEECKKLLSLPQRPASQTAIDEQQVPPSLDAIVLAKRPTTGHYLPAIVLQVPSINKKKPQIYRVRDICTGEELLLPRRDLLIMYDDSPMELDATQVPVYPRKDTVDIKQEESEQVAMLGTIPRTTTLAPDALKWADLRKGVTTNGAYVKNQAPIPALYQSGATDVPGILDIVGANSKEVMAFWRQGTTLAGSHTQTIWLDKVKGAAIAVPKGQGLRYAWLKFEMFDGTTHEFGTKANTYEALLAIGKLFRRQFKEREQREKHEEEAARSNNDTTPTASAPQTRARPNTFCANCGAPLAEDRYEEDVCESCHVCKNCGEMLVPEEYESEICEDCAAEDMDID